MAASSISAGPARASLVADSQYPAVLLETIAAARRRLLCSLFIVDLSPSRDREGLVHAVLVACAGAAWRGLDVRLLVGGSRTNFAIAQLAAVATKVAGDLGIDCRWLTRTDVRGSHSKLVIADDRVLVGSHNWSVGAFSSQTQDSVLVESPPLAEYVAEAFGAQWRRAE